MPPEQLDTLLHAYRQCVFEDANKLRLETIHSAGASRKRDLAGIYVALDTQTPKPKPDAERHQDQRTGEGAKPEYVSALEAVIQNRHVVLHGAPGSGKSTFVQFLSLCLAGEVLHPDQSWHQRLPGWPKTEARLVPFTIELRRFAKECPRLLTGKALPAHLWEYLAQELKNSLGNEVVSAARSALETGRAIILLDGLDEIAEPPPAEGEEPAEGRCQEAHTRIWPMNRPCFGIPPPHSAFRTSTKSCIGIAIVRFMGRGESVQDGLGSMVLPP